jgi:hypothetical protein
MLVKQGFYDSRWNEKTNGLRHLYELIERNGKKMVIDHTTWLTWQQSDSSKPIKHEQVNAYIAGLNKDNFGGYNDWRLPTIEETTSLIEPKNPHIHPVFDQTNRWTRTADKANNSKVWVVDLSGAICSIGYENRSFYIRAVRSNQ